jgi:hypothetical protein
MGMRILLLPNDHQDVPCGLSHPAMKFSTNSHPVYGSKGKYERKSKNKWESLNLNGIFFNWKNIQK